MIEVEYSSNNSGGDWWLKDADWLALEQAGWYVVWGGVNFCHSKYSDARVPPICKKGDKCRGHRVANSADTVKERWLGALAKAAKKSFPTIRDAIEEFERVTGQSASDDGCGCCGPPHSFSWEQGEQYGYASGEDALTVLYPEQRVTNLRDVLDEARRLREEAAKPRVENPPGKRKIILDTKGAPRAERPRQT